MALGPLHQSWPVEADKKQSEAYREGVNARRSAVARVCNPYDGRTRKGKNWDAGFMAIEKPSEN